jgi:hypothetical protein
MTGTMSFMKTGTAVVLGLVCSLGLATATWTLGAGSESGWSGSRIEPPKPAVEPLADIADASVAVSRTW